MSSSSPILVTGANGFLGSWILARLADDGRNVVASDLVCDSSRLLQIRDAAAVGDIDWRPCDVADADAVARLVDAVAPEVIIHLAALQIPGCRANPALGARVNIEGHINIFEAVRRAGTGKIIYTSSIAAKPRGPANAPANLYGVFKKTDEEIARIYWQDHQVPSLGLRPHIVYGVGRDDGETSAITEAVRAAAHGNAYEMPFATRSCFQYAGEVAEVFSRAISADWQGAVVSDITTEIESTDDVLEAIRRAEPEADVKPSSNERASPMTGLDNGPLVEIIGPWPRTSLSEGIGETLGMFRKFASR